MITTINWRDLTPEHFLKEYWQKKPLLLKKAFNQFQDTIDANELAGLAMESEIESRIVSFIEPAHKQKNTQKKWQVDHGPFEDFSQYGEQNWTLLVQAVNNWSTETQQLLNAFNFVPRWRIDDVMVSFSTPNGGVGAHLDQYDVFIIQGSGKRRWQVGAPDSNLANILPHPDLKQVGDFTPIIDEITEAGDLLYIPPNHPHNGVAIENSMNFSVGFQAPSAQELWSGFADQLIDQNLAETRYSDPEFNTKLTNTELTNTTLTAHNVEISQQDIKQLKQFMLAQLDNEEFFQCFLAKQLTQNHHSLEILVPVTAIDKTKLTDILAEADMQISPVLGIKSALVGTEQRYFAINGECFALTAHNITLANILAQSTALTTEQLQAIIKHNDDIELLLSLLNKGYWYVQ